MLMIHQNVIIPIDPSMLCLCPMAESYVTLSRILQRTFQVSFQLRKESCSDRSAQILACQSLPFFWVDKKWRALIACNCTIKHILCDEMNQYGNVRWSYSSIRNNLFSVYVECTIVAFFLTFKNHLALHVKMVALYIDFDIIVHSAATL